jgi:hypothetical protein
MDSTRLNLLTRDGAVAVVFCPALEDEHYTQFRERVADTRTPQELRDMAISLAGKWGRSGDASRLLPRLFRHCDRRQV